MSSPIISGESPGDRLGDLADRLGTSVTSLVVGTAATVGLAVLAWFALFRADSAAPELTIPYASTTSTAPRPAPDESPATTEPTVMLVHAAGAVRHPGVYSMAPGSRVSDLLAAAGGPLLQADLNRVNLAAPVADGSRVYVPQQGEDPPPVVAGETSAAPGGQAPALDPGRAVNLNTATAQELEALPGVGPATAAAIIEHRDRHGAFVSVDQLIEVRGIGEAKLAALRDLVHV